MSGLTIDSLLSLKPHIAPLPVTDALKKFVSTFPGAVTFSTSFGPEDQVITDLIAKSGADISLFTLDTGRLFPETYSTWSRTIEQYRIRVKAYYPDEEQIGSFVTDNGPNAFYESVELRQQCCHIRKVVPLKKALEGQAVWITGLRAEHSGFRNNLDIIEWDEDRKLIKYNPLLHWTTAEVTAYIKQHSVPNNPLFDKGFISIGCAPCTRAIKPGEDFRPAAGGGKTQQKKNVACIHIKIIT